MKFTLYPGAPFYSLSQSVEVGMYGEVSTTPMREVCMYLDNNNNTNNTNNTNAESAPLRADSDWHPSCLGAGNGANVDGPRSPWISSQLTRDSMFKPYENYENIGENGFGSLGWCLRDVIWKCTLWLDHFQFGKEPRFKTLLLWYHFNLFGFARCFFGAHWGGQTSATCRLIGHPKEFSFH